MTYNVFGEMLNFTQLHLYCTTSEYRHSTSIYIFLLSHLLCRCKALTSLVFADVPLKNCSRSLSLDLFIDDLLSSVSVCLVVDHVTFCTLVMSNHL